jgi:hypothetical protein
MKLLVNKKKEIVKENHNGVVVVLKAQNKRYLKLNRQVTIRLSEFLLLE